MTVFTLRHFKNLRGTLILTLTWEVGEHFPSQAEWGLDMAMPVLSGKVFPCPFPLNEPLPEDQEIMHLE